MSSDAEQPPPQQNSEAHHTPTSTPRPRRKRAALLGVVAGLLLFVLGQGVVLDRSGEDYAQALNGLGVLFLVTVVVSLFVQAALQDWRQHDKRSEAAEEASADAPRQERRDAYWFTAGLALAGVVILSVTLTGTRLMPQLLPAAPAQIESEVDDERMDQPRRRPFDRSPRDPEEHRFNQGD